MSLQMSPFAGWSTAAYLKDYYSTVAEDEEATLRFLVDTLAGEPLVDEALEFGAGPTVHHALALAPHAKAIDVADLLVENLNAVQAWVERRPEAHDWRAFTRHVLRCEGRSAAPNAVAAREHHTRGRLRRLLPADVAQPHPLGVRGHRRYGIVVSCFCADSVTRHKAAWSCYMRHIAGLVAPGGLLLLAALRRCTSYRVGAMSFPSACVDEHDVAARLALEGFDPAGTRIEVATAPRQRRLGYDGVVLAAARLAAGPPRRSQATSGNVTAMKHPNASALAIAATAG
jgi:NNMT/PNMT/TEMT family